MRVVAFSDSHGFEDCLNLPDGDILLFSGDMCGPANLEQVERFGDFLAKQPHKHKIVIAGNHDWPFERDNKAAREALGDVAYLQDEEITVDGVKIYGSPWQPEFFNWAFNLPRGAPLRKIWAKIPDDTNILLTHGPPHAILDQTSRGVAVGCEALRERVEELESLKLHVFGHIHEAYGKIEMAQTTFCNASVCDLAQRDIANPPWIFDL